MNILNQPLLYALGLLLPLTAATADTADCKNPQGVWRTESGSTLHLKSVEESGRMSGFFQLSPDVDSTKYDLIGWFTPDNAEDDNGVISPISVSVHWKALGSITSWVGTCDETSGEPKIKLIGHQVKLHARAPNERITTQMDFFHVDE